MVRVYYNIKGFFLPWSPLWTGGKVFSALGTGIEQGSLGIQGTFRYACIHFLPDYQQLLTFFHLFSLSFDVF